MKHSKEYHLMRLRWKMYKRYMKSHMELLSALVDAQLITSKDANIEYIAMKGVDELLQTAMQKNVPVENMTKTLKELPDVSLYEGQRLKAEI